MAASQKNTAVAEAPRPTTFTNQILIVDDETTARELCKEFLEIDGYGIETAENARKGLALLSSKKFDLVLTDLSMPDMTGIELVRQIRTQHPSTSVIIMTAFGSVQTAVESMKAGAYDYITKPFPRDLLRATVRRSLEAHNLRREVVMMQQELYKKEKLAAVGSMAGAIAHRMRNPLSIIQMCAQYLQSKMLDNKEYLEVLQAIEEKVKTLENLTRDFVEYSRASRIRKVPAALEKLTDDVIQNVMPRCKVQGVEIIKKYSNPVPQILVDVDLIKEVLTNIVDNALEAMKGVGTVTIVIRTDELGYLYLGVTNTGSVLPEELRDKIFEPFFTTKETGMGLGLAIVKQVIDGHGGKIIPVGDPKTKTTTFHIFLPLKEEQKEAA